MDEKVSDHIASNYSKYEKQEIDWASMSQVLLDGLKKCDNFNDVTNLIYYCTSNEAGIGLDCARKIADTAFELRNLGTIKAISRNGVETSKAIEYMTLANSFAKYSCAQDGKYFMKFIGHAENSATNSLDFRLLAGHLYDGCNNLEDPSVDTEYHLTKKFIVKAVELCVEESNTRGIEDMIDLTKNRIGDKELVKRLNALKKKLKK